MPFKNTFAPLMDEVLPVSKQGAEYLLRTYDFRPAQIRVRYLGVEIPAKLTDVGDEHEFRLLSVSSCIAVKRIDRIIEALAIAAQQLSDCTIHWTHIGDGPLFTSLLAHSRRRLNHPRTTYEFLGALPNSGVQTYYSTQKVDLFINASESEGVPVSVMEAMSYGVPTIAPSVGGLSEIVSAECGCILSAEPTYEELANAIVDMVRRSRDLSLREKSREHIRQHFNARQNYTSIVDSIGSGT
jgi:glycosyltransferase involved in cell wall biosynthesis